jgi:precorrin-4/cobalt-precorrin-4 C11-methyltransferase
MKVYFIGAGPGDPDLITVKALRAIKACPVCLYAGSLVPEAVVSEAPEGALVLDTAAMTLDDTHGEILAAQSRNEDVARVHSGDPSLYGAIAEQIRRLNKDGVEFEIIPGVPAYAAMAAALKQELTIPEIAQSIVLTRTSMKSTGMPSGETIESFAKTGATLAIHLSVRNMRELERQLTPYYGEDCPVVVGYRVSWPDELLIRGTLSDIRKKVRKSKITRTALIMVGPALAQDIHFQDSALYDASKPHVLRPVTGVELDEPNNT